MPHQVRRTLKPTVSRTRARAPTATVSIGRFSRVICEMNYRFLSWVIIICWIVDDLQKEHWWQRRSSFRGKLRLCMKEFPLHWSERRHHKPGSHRRQRQFRWMQQQWRLPCSWRTHPWSLRLERAGRCHRISVQAEHRRPESCRQCRAQWRRV